MVAVIEILTAFWQLLIAPIKNPEMLWILGPVYLNWILTDYYQERKGTSFGNAMSNGFVALWVGLDWTRQLRSGFEGFDAAFWIKLAVSVAFIAYGLLIMVESARAKPIIKYVGRIREVSYLVIVATPIYYNVVPLNLSTLIAILLFFPIWYGLGELIDRLLGPSLAEQQEESEGLGKGAGDLGDLGKMPEFSDLNAGGMGGQPAMGVGQFGQQPQQNYPTQNYPQQGQQYPPQF